MAQLVAPVMPQDDHYALDALQRGFQGLAANRRYAQSVELHLQQLAQQEKLRQQEFALEQQRIDNQYEVQQEQIKNYQSMEAARAQNIERLKKAEEHVGPLVAEMSKIPNNPLEGGWGSQPAADAWANLVGKYATETDIFDTPRGAQLQRLAELKQRRGEMQLESTRDFIGRQLAQSFGKKNLDPSYANYVQVDEKGKPVPNQYFGVHEDGSLWMARGPLTQTTNTGTVITPGLGDIIPPTHPNLVATKKEEGGMTSAEQKAAGIRFINFSPQETRNIVSMARQRDKIIQAITGGTISDKPGGEQVSHGVLQGDQNPAPAQVNQGTRSAVPDAAIAYLKSNPNTRDKFDAKYGAGASAAILGQ